MNYALCNLGTLTNNPRAPQQLFVLDSQGAHCAEGLVFHSGKGKHVEPDCGKEMSGEVIQSSVHFKETFFLFFVTFSTFSKKGKVMAKVMCVFVVAFLPVPGIICVGIKCL